MRFQKIEHMKTKVALRYMIFSLLFVFAFAAMAQDNDDMYFNSKDRAKLKAQKETEVSASVKSSKKNASKDVKEEEESVNPTDSYSARTVNPEFAARSNAQTAQEDDQEYFVNNYQYNTSSNLNNWNNNYSSWYNNPWYTSSWFGPSINSWNSRYYGYNDPYYSPWYDPYWNYNGWSASFSYHYGNSWNYGWGGNYNYWNRPYCGWANSWGPSYSWGSWGYPGYYYGYPGTVIVVDRGEAASYRNYGKRPSRSSVAARTDADQYVRTSNGRVYTPSSRETQTNGRQVVREGRTSTSNSAPAEQYYDRAWRRTQQAQQSSSPSYTPSRQNSSSWGNSGYTAPRQRSYSQDNNSYSSPSRSSSNNSYSAPSRNSSSSFGSGSSGGSRSGSSMPSSSGGSRRGRD